MSLADWQKNGWLKAHKTSRNEIADLMAVVDRDLAASKTPGLHNDWSFNIAYNAALQLATAALAASGYQAERANYRVIDSLSLNPWYGCWDNQEVRYLPKEAEPFGL